MKLQHIVFFTEICFFFPPKDIEEPELVIRHFAIISLSRFIVIMSILCFMNKTNVRVYFN